MARAPQELSGGLCDRQFGQRAEWHHVIPKSEGGTQTVPVHPIYHRTIHAFVANRKLATSYTTTDQLREREDVCRYLQWIANKPPDFRAPTRRQKAICPQLVVQSPLPASQLLPFVHLANGSSG